MDLLEGLERTEHINRCLKMANELCSQCPNRNNCPKECRRKGLKNLIEPGILAIEERHTKAI